MRHSFQQRVIALILLMAYTITGTSILPAAMVLAAGIDDSHTVIVSHSDAGTRLTLHHRSNDYTPALADHRSSLARALVSLCKVSDAGDHLLSSSQIKSNADKERETLNHLANHDAGVNAAATFLLSLTAPQPIRDTTRVLVFQEWHIRPQSITPMLACVQLLI